MWRELTEDDVLAAMNSAEAAAFRGQLLAEGQSDPLPEVMSQVALEIREAIRSWPKNVLSPAEGEIPSGAVRHAAALVRHRLATRFSDTREVSEARLMEYREAVRYLDMVASGKRAVERYGDEEDVPAPVARPAVSEPVRQFGRASQDGI